MKLIIYRYNKNNKNKYTNNDKKDVIGDLRTHITIDVIYNYIL